MNDKTSSKGYQKPKCKVVELYNDVLAATGSTELTEVGSPWNTNWGAVWE